MKITTWVSLQIILTFDAASTEKLKVIDLKLEEIGKKMRHIEEIKIYLTAKRNRIHE